MTLDTDLQAQLQEHMWDVELFPSYFFPYFHFEIQYADEPCRAFDAEAITRR